MAVCVNRVWEAPLRQKIYSVGEICRDIKGLLEGGFPDGAWVEGEISNLRLHSSGHVYFSLKDPQAILGAVMFRGNASRLRFELKDGLKVLAFGSIGIYESRGVYQINVQRLEPKGLGGLQLALEQLKAKLQAEGLFDPERKKPIPVFPQRIAVVTSPTGAAIRDILNVLGRRFSNLHISIYPTAVQGEGAAQEMAKALQDLNELGGFDVVLVTRGGGSLEDLWAFNEEVLARAVAASRIPVISAVGHEVDYTLCDFAADLRCPTPSAAAELVIGRKDEMEGHLERLREDLWGALENLVSDRTNRLQLAVRSHGFLESGRLVETYMQKLDDATEAMASALSHGWEMKQKDFQRFAERLGSLNPLAVLGRGYSITFEEKTGRVLRRSSGIKPGEQIKTVLEKGTVFSTVSRVEQGS